MEQNYLKVDDKKYIGDKKVKDEAILLFGFQKGITDSAELTVFNQVLGAPL